LCCCPRAGLAGGKFTIYQPIPLYRKFTADHIFTGHEILSGNEVLITDQSGKVLDIVPNEQAGDGVRYFKGMLSPGFINSHCHLELSHMRGIIPRHTGLVEFVQQVMGKRTASAEERLLAMQATEQELYQTGTVAVGDICNTTDSIEIKKSSAMRWHNFIEVSGFVGAVAQKRLDAVKQVSASFLEAGLNQAVTLVPHAPYSVSEKLFQLLNEETAHQLISIHNQEAEAENELYKTKSGDFLKLYQNMGIDISAFQPTGKSSLQSWLPYFTHQQSIILVHNSFTSKDDLEFSQPQSPTANRQLPTSYCLCPNANLYIENKLPPIDLLLKHDANIILGTDSYASNNQLNILEEIKIIQRESSGNIPTATILQWATLNAAKVFGWDDALGSFDRGKQPGIVHIDGLDGVDTTEDSVARRVKI
jgi:cytosine/adenosine deaminase-related metal-dependent hydrolase